MAIPFSVIEDVFDHVDSAGPGEPAASVERRDAR